MVLPGERVVARERQRRWRWRRRQQRQRQQYLGRVHPGVEVQGRLTGVGGKWHHDVRQLLLLDSGVHIRPRPGAGRAVGWG